MASNVTGNENNNNNPMWVVMLLLFVWILIFFYKIKHQVGTAEAPEERVIVSASLAV
jgi:LPXTG-motif cell wall-anchored protein